MKRDWTRINHELRTPLNQIIGLTQLLIEECRASGSQASISDLRQIEEAAYHLLDLLDEMFRACKIVPTGDSGEEGDGS